jgi:Ca-activated chloride channel family protein
MLLLIYCASFVIPVNAQDEKKIYPETRPRKIDEGPVIQSDEIIRIDTDLLLFDVTATDERGEPVRGLSAADFKIYEDDVARPIAFFNIEKKSGAKRPIAVVFALDVSGSMTPDEFARLRLAMRVFVQKLADRQSVFAVMSFGMQVKTLQSFTSDPAKLEKAFDKLEREESGLSTHAYDAVDDAIRLLVNKAPKTKDKRLLKRSVLLISDGFPVGDTVSPKTVIERANAADVSVYSVTLPSYSRLLASTEKQPLPTPLDVSGLIDKTGGKNFYATERDFEPLFRALAEEVVSSYVLAFYPREDKKSDGKFHTVRIEGPRGLIIRQSRPGYQAKKQ